MSLETHIVKAYTQEIAHLTTMIAEMGGYSQAAVAEAMQALRRRDSAQAMRVVEGDRKIDSLEAQISGYVVRLLALRQPMANDLCTIVAGLKIAGDLERIGDYAKNNAKHVIELNKSPVAGPIAGVGNLGRMVELMLDEVLDAYVVGDATAAETVRARDEDVDDVHTGLFRELVNCMTENSRTVTSCTHLVFIAKNLERIGDHATNIADNVVFQATRQRPADRHEKFGQTSLSGPGSDRRIRGQ